jgi:hypothetical protein
MRVLGFLLLFTFASYSQACEIALKMQTGNSEMQQHTMEKVAITALESKDYLKNDKPTQKVVIQLRKKSDPHNPMLLHAYAALTIRRIDNGEMQFYTHGNGKSYKKPSDAYSEENFKIAIEKAVSHLPNCQ